MENNNIKTDYELIELGIRNPLLRLNKNVFRKSDAEKDRLKLFRKEHTKRVREAGFNPRKRMNLTPPQHLKFSAS